MHHRASYRIVVDVSAKRLDLFRNGSKEKSYPIAVGKVATETPYGEFTIINKAPNPGGPYGAYWLGLSKPHYGIHGTNQPWTIGQAVSKGCIRMYNRDVIELAEKVSIGTPVTIHA